MTARGAYFRGIVWILGVFGILVLASLLITHLDLDRKVSALFFSETGGWYLKYAQPWDFLYKYGTIPGFLLTLGAVAGYLVARLRNWGRAWCNAFLLVALTSLIGAGILVNTVLKPYWGRPRPAQTVEFGGVLEYRPVYSPGIPGRGASFPCGHCTMGFLFLSLAFLRRQSRILAWSGLASGILLGGGLSITRIVQGGHYLSDTLWSLGIILMVAGGLHYFFLGVPTGVQPSKPIKKRTRVLLVGGIGLLVVLMIAAFSTRRPYYDGYQCPMEIGGEIHRVTITLNEPLEREAVVYKDIPQPRLIVYSHGFGRSSADRKIHVDARAEGDALDVTVRVDRSGFFSELDHEVELWLPRSMENHVHGAIASQVDQK